MTEMMSPATTMGRSTMTTTLLMVAETPTPSHLSESNHEFQLWYTALIALSLLLVISMVFVMIVLLCRIMKEKKSKRHIYTSRSQQGSVSLKGSVYQIRSQENLESASAHYHNQTYEVHIPENRSESPVRGITMNQDEEIVQDVPRPAGSGEIARSLRLSEEDLFEEIEEETDSEGEAHMYDTPFDNSVINQQHQSTHSQQNITDGTSDNSIHQRYQNSQPERFSRDMQESQHSRETTAGNHVIAVANPSVTVTVAFEDDSNLHDIPGFHDPELKGDVEDNNGLCVNVPPTIYSSQILSTVVHDQEETEGYIQNGIETSDMGMGIESAVISSDQENPVDSPLVDFTADNNNLPPTERLSEEGSSHQSRETSGTESHWLTSEGLEERSRERNDGLLHHHGLQPVDDDVLYDQPIISHGLSSAGAKDSDDLHLDGVDPRMLFDDPGYTKGMTQGSQEQQLSMKENQPSNAVSKQEFVPLKQAHRLEVEPGGGVETQTLSVQLARAPGMKSSINSLALLNFDESELEELDPTIASCLRTPIMSDTDDEIAISEV